MNSYCFSNARLVNEGEQYTACLLIEGQQIAAIHRGAKPPANWSAANMIDAKAKLLMPGMIDDQVHFREPGLTHKADIYSESRAAVAGGITSYMEMPNTQPPATTQQLLEEKYRIASKSSLANYSFYIGATNDNLDELLQTKPESICGIKVFMGSSTGNMLVDKVDSLAKIFEQAPCLIATHCEDEATIRANTALFRERYGEDMPIGYHADLRSAEACYRSSSLAVDLAKRYNSRLHVLHLSTARELALFDNKLPLSQKRITAEVCVHHLWFDEHDYTQHGTQIKWNPAVKSPNDRDALRRALIDNRIDVVATDHAPHTIAEKNNSYFKAPSGAPMVQHAVVAMLEFYHRELMSLEQIVEKLCHAPAALFRIKNRGYIRPGYQADLLLIDLNANWTVNKENLLYKCGWSPMEGQSFHSQISHTFVNGHLAYCKGLFDDSRLGQRLRFVV